MLFPANASHKLQLVASVAADFRVRGSIMRISAAAPPIPQGNSTLHFNLASITGTSQDLYTADGTLPTRLLELFVRNHHASQASDLTLQYTDGTNVNPAPKCTMLPGELLVYDGAKFLHYDSNMGLYAAVPSLQLPSLLVPPFFTTAALTGTRTITSTNSFAVYLGKAPRSLSSVALRLRVTTAAATITWAEVAIAKGLINIGGNPTLTVVGFADVSAVINSTGQKSVTVNVSSGQSVQYGDDLWAIIGNQATTAAVVRAQTMADDLSVGACATVVARPSTIVGTPTAFTNDGATNLPPWVYGVV